MSMTPSSRARLRTQAFTAPPASPMLPGFVEYVNDPLGLRRVKVRIPSEHGDVDSRPTQDLPWASVANQGNSYDSGGSMPLQVGMQVWVILVNNDPEYPVVIAGTGPSIPMTPQVYGQTRPDLLPISENDTNLGAWRGESVVIDEESETEVFRGQTEAPKEIRRSAANEPTVYLPFKTMKGAAICMEDADGREYMQILDRAGQGLLLHGPIHRILNRGNNYQRGLRSVFSGTQFNYQADTENRESSVGLRDLAQQGIQTFAKKTDERVKIVSKVPSEDDYGYIDFELGDTVHTLELGAGTRRTLIQGTTRQGIMFQLSFDSQKGVIEIESRLSVTVKSQKVTLAADRIYLQGDVVIDGNLTVSGDGLVAGSITEGAPKRDRPINYR